MGRPEGKAPLVRPRRRWENNIKINFEGVEWGGMDWIDLAGPRERGNEHSCSIKCGKFLD